MKASKFKVSRFDLLNSAVAALRDGLGPLYNLYLVNNLGLDPSQIGYVMGASSAAMLVAQVPIGYLYDRMKRKGLLIAAAAGGMLVGALAFRANAQPSFALTMGIQILFGVATSALALGIPALTVAVTDDEHLGGRMARNEIFAKGGNLATLAVAGVLTHIWSLRMIFLIWPLLAVPAIALALTSKSKKKALKRQKWSRSALTSSPTFYWFVAAVFLLYLANTGGLVLFEQIFAPAHANGGAEWIALVSALAQGSVTLTIMGLARVKTPRGLVISLAATFALIVLRLGVLAAGSSVANLIGGQLLDGVIGGALFSVPIRLLADQHRGEFNVLSGVLGSVGALGALASVFVTGPLMNHFGYPGSLFTFMVPAALGAVVVVVARRPLEGRR